MTAQEFVDLVKRMKQTKNADDAIATINRLIGEARKIELDEATNEEIDAARNLYGSDEVEVDGNALASRGGDDGVWVSAWLWVPDSEL